MSTVPRLTSLFLAAALVLHLVLLALGRTAPALSVLFGSLTAAVNLFLFSWLIRRLVHATATGDGQAGRGVGALAPLKFFALVGAVLFFLSRSWIHAATFLVSHGAVLLGVALSASFLEREPGR